MSTEHNDGGPAFPCKGPPHFSEAAGLDYPTFSGMTLRDWFAGQALAAMQDSYGSYNQALAERAYKVADAMLAARATTKGRKV